MPSQNRIFEKVSRVEVGSFNALLFHVMIDLVLVLVNLTPVLAVGNSHGRRESRPYETLYSILFRRVNQVLPLLFLTGRVVYDLLPPHQSSHPNRGKETHAVIEVGYPKDSPTAFEGSVYLGWYSQVSANNFCTKFFKGHRSCGRRVPSECPDGVLLGKFQQILCDRPP